MDLRDDRRTPSPGPGRVPPACGVRRDRWTLTFACVAALAAVHGCAGGVPAPLEVGDAAPSFALPAVARGGMVDSGSTRGKITVLNFWTTSCSVCLKETEDLGQVHRGGKALVIGIALDPDPDYLGRFVKDRKIEYPVLAGNEDVFSRYDGAAVPYTLVLDRTGKVRRKAYGRVDSAELSRIIAEIDGPALARGGS